MSFGRKRRESRIDFWLVNHKRRIKRNHNKIQMEKMCEIAEMATSELKLNKINEIFSVNSALDTYTQPKHARNALAAVSYFAELSNASSCMYKYCWRANNANESKAWNDSIFLCITYECGGKNVYGNNVRPMLSFTGRRQSAGESLTSPCGRVCMCQHKYAHICLEITIK